MHAQLPSHQIVPTYNKPIKTWFPTHRVMPMQPSSCTVPCASIPARSHRDLDQIYEAVDRVA